MNTFNETARNENWNSSSEKNAKKQSSMEKKNQCITLFDNRIKKVILIYIFCNITGMLGEKATLR